MVRPVADERDGLLAFLAQQRDAIRLAGKGLSLDQITSAPTASSLNLAGLMKHLAGVERFWISLVTGTFTPIDFSRGRDWSEVFRLMPGESLAGVMDDYADAAAETEAAITAVADLGQAVPVPPGIPWFPPNIEAWSVRWVLLHLIQETARHAGHADIIRETIDGESVFIMQVREP
jgi:uncharacterized damage-inducible protein DinB